MNSLQNYEVWFEKQCIIMKVMFMNLGLLWDMYQRMVKGFSHILMQSWMWKFFSHMYE